MSFVLGSEGSILPFVQREEPELVLVEKINV